MGRLLELAKNDLVNARDNLHRAKAATLRHPPNEQYGQSGQTLQQIIDGYAEWEAEAEKTVAEAERTEQKRS